MEKREALRLKSGCMGADGKRRREICDHVQVRGEIVVHFRQVEERGEAIGDVGSLQYRSRRRNPPWHRVPSFRRVILTECDRRNSSFSRCRAGRQFGDSREWFRRGESPSDTTEQKQSRADVNREIGT